MLAILPTLVLLLQQPAVPGALLVHASRWLDLDVPTVRLSSLRTGLSPAEHAQQIEVLLGYAGGLVDRALAGLDADERTFARGALDSPAQSLCDDVMIQRDSDRARFRSITRLLQIAPRVDRAVLTSAALHLATLIHPEYLAGWRMDLADREPGIFLTHPTPYGNIVFAGKGRTWFRDPTAVIIDLGGDDVYSHPAGGAASLVIDLEGNDAYEATFAGAQAAGILGVSLVYDQAGDDSYIGRRYAQGVGLLGIGVLWDRAGSDSYRASDFSQGTAFAGVGLTPTDAINTGSAPVWCAPVRATTAGRACHSWQIWAAPVTCTTVRLRRTTQFVTPRHTVSSSICRVTSMRHGCGSANGSDAEDP